MASLRQKELTFLYALAVGSLTVWLLYPYTATWIRQGEVQCFIPEWTIIREMLCHPSGFQTVVGEACVALMQHPWQAVILHALWLLLVVLLNLALLQKFSQRAHNYVLALIPVIPLAGAHLSPFYVLDGTVGWTLLLLAVWGYLCIAQSTLRLVYAVITTLLLFGCTGQFVALYGISLLLLHYLTSQKKGLSAWIACGLGLMLTGLYIRLSLGVPLTDGIYSERYQQAQLQPESYLYYTALRQTLYFAATWIAAAFFQHLSEEKLISCMANTLLLVVGCAVVWQCRPDENTRITNRMNQLALVEQTADWERLYDTVCEQPIHDYISLNYLCLSLAERGTLADSLFHHDPNGPQSLLSTWDRSYYSSVLLSDLHFLIGDLSLSESYAMEGLTLAKRGGSSWMLRRMENLSRLRGEERLAQKYTNLLNRLHAAPQEFPEQATPLVAPRSEGADALQGQSAIDSLWMQRLEARDLHPMLWQYAGCSLLLSKDLNEFRHYLELWKKLIDKPLPAHFEEAAQILDLEQPGSTPYTFSDEQTERFLQFRTEVLRAKQQGTDLTNLRLQYGHTYWFYHYCKKIAL